MERESFPGKRRVREKSFSGRTERERFFEGRFREREQIGDKNPLERRQGKEGSSENSEKKAASEGLRENRHLKILHGRKRERKILLS